LILNVKISPDGTQMKGLYKDDLGWQQMGKCEIDRASHVEFDTDTQQWKIFIIAEKRYLKTMYTNRAEAIQAEVDYLNGILFCN